MSTNKELKKLTKIVALHVLSKHEEDDMRIYEMLIELWTSLAVEKSEECDHNFDLELQCRNCGAKIMPLKKGEE